MGVNRGIAEYSVVFYGGKIGVAVGTGTTSRGTEKHIPTPFVAFQELVDAVEIGSDVPKDAAEFPPRLFVFFRKKESVDVVIRALERVKVKLEELEKAKAAADNVKVELETDLKEGDKDDSKQGVPT